MTAAESSMLAADLAFAAWPEWLAADTAYRFGPLIGDAVAGAGRPLSWRIYYRAAIDHSRLPIVPRTVLRVLLDRTGDDGSRPPDTVPEISATDIGERVPCHPDHVLRAIAELESAGWLGVIRRAGLVPVLTLFLPCGRPADPRATRGGNPRATRGTPRATRGGPPRHARDTGDKETGRQSGDPPLTKSDAVTRGGADPWEGFYAPVRYDGGPTDE